MYTPEEDCSEQCIACQHWNTHRCSISMEDAARKHSPDLFDEENTHEVGGKLITDLVEKHIEGQTDAQPFD